LNFGDSELRIRDDFKTVKSDFSSSYLFALNGEIFLRDKVRSIIPHLKSFNPTKMEIWVFDQAPSIFGTKNRNNEEDSAYDSEIMHYNDEDELFENISKDND